MFPRSFYYALGSSHSHCSIALFYKVDFRCPLPLARSPLHFEVLGSGIASVILVILPYLAATLGPLASAFGRGFSLVARRC